MTTSLSFAQWWICIGIAASLAVVEEAYTYFVRRASTRPGVRVPTIAVPALAEP